MPGEKILLVENDPQMLEMLTEFLEGQWYAVSTATDSHQALAAIEAEEFNLALINLNLPGLSGLELLSRIKRQSPHTEIILLTEHGELESAVQALRLGAYDYLMKSSLRLPKLQSVVVRALERQQFAQTNLKLVDHVRQAQEGLEKRRAAGLAQVRRISETLSASLTGDQLFQELSGLIWESLSLNVLGLEALGLGEPPLEVYRSQPVFPGKIFQEFKDWLKGHLLFIQKGRANATITRPKKLPLPFLLWEKMEVEDVSVLVAAGRDEPFSGEEADLFRIFILQGEAALKNLVLLEKVKSLAIRDELTGLYNSRYFTEALEYEVNKSGRYHFPLSMLLLDIDDFSMINNRYGHTHAEKILKQVGAILKKNIRKADLLCRSGADEFALLLSQTSLKQAKVLASRMGPVISQTPIQLLNQDVKVTVSIGLAGLEPKMDGESLVNAARAALHRAKETGKNKVCGPEESAVNDTDSP